MSSLAKKFIMAFTGIILVGFALGHMAGNLQMFLHPDWINEYAYKLQTLPYGLLWIVRGGLLLAVVAHILAAVALVLENKKARPEKYAVKHNLQASFASRTMRYSGLIVLAFILFHIAHYTTQNINPAFRTLETPLLGVDSGHGYNHSQTLWGVYDKLTEHGQNPDSPANNVHDVYSMVANGFRSPIVSGFYLIAMALLSIHLSHGVSSMFQSLGLRNAVWRPRLDKLAVIIGVVVFLGFSSIPVACLAGFIQPTQVIASCCGL